MSWMSLASIRYSALIENNFYRLRSCTSFLNGPNFKISNSILDSIVKCEPKSLRIDPKTFRPIPNQKRMFIGTDKTRRRNKPGYKIDRNRR